MKKLHCLYGLALLVVLVGCGSSDGTANVAQTQAGPGGGTPKVGDTVNGTKVVNTPPKEIPSGGIMLQPDNPNDPHFKPDPNLRGGG